MVRCCCKVCTWNAGFIACLRLYTCRVLAFCAADAGLSHLLCISPRELHVSIHLVLITAVSWIGDFPYLLLIVWWWLNLLGRWNWNKPFLLRVEKSFIPVSKFVKIQHCSIEGVIQFAFFLAWVDWSNFYGSETAFSYGGLCLLASLQALYFPMKPWAAKVDCAFEDYCHCEDMTMAQQSLFHGMHKNFTLIICLVCYLYVCLP